MKFEDYFFGEIAIDKHLPNNKPDLASASIFLDTNILLDLYRLKKESQDEVLKILSTCQSRIWITGHIIKEVQKNRTKVIRNTESKYSEISDPTEKFRTVILSSLKSKQHPSIVDTETKEIEQNLNSLCDMIAHAIAQSKNDLATENNDHVLSSISAIIDNKIHTLDFNEELKEEINTRMDANLPPGFDDKSKSGNGDGDIRIWLEMIDYAKTHNKDILFVTNDGTSSKKTDLFLKHNGQTVGPLPELLDEFHNKTNQRIYIYNLETFIRLQCCESTLELNEAQIDLLTMELEAISLEDTKVKETEEQEGQEQPPLDPMIVFELLKKKHDSLKDDEYIGLSRFVYTDLKNIYPPLAFGAINALDREGLIEFKTLQRGEYLIQTIVIPKEKISN